MDYHYRLKQVQHIIKLVLITPERWFMADIPSYEAESKTKDITFTILGPSVLVIDDDCKNIWIEELTYILWSNCVDISHQ